MTYFIGIDPGFTGAVAITKNSKVIDIIPCPLLKIGTGKIKIVNLKRVEETKTRMDSKSLSKALSKYTKNSFCVIEHSQAMPKQGISSTFIYAEGYGKYLGVLDTLDIPYHEVRSSIWKAKMGLDSNKYNSIDNALELYPDSKKYIKLRKDDGKAEALLLAHYAEYFVHVS